MALKIREVAEANNVPIFEAPPLARALHGMVEIGHEIPGDLFKAVAQVLAYIFQLKTVGQQTPLNRLRPVISTCPTSIEVKWYDNECPAINPSG